MHTYNSPNYLHGKLYPRLHDSIYTSLSLSHHTILVLAYKINLTRSVFMNFMKCSLFLWKLALDIVCFCLDMKTDGAKETQTIIGAGGKTMNLKTYTMMVGNLSVTAQVTENGCIPVSESIVGSTPGRQYTISLLSWLHELGSFEKKIHCCILFQGLSTWGPVSLGLPLEFLTPPFSTLPSAVWWVPFIPLYVLSLNITNWTRDSSSPCKAKITKWLHKPTHSLIIKIFLKQLFFFFSGDSSDEKSILPSSSVDSSFFQHMFSYSFFVLITK